MSVSVFAATLSRLPRRRPWLSWLLILIVLAPAAGLNAQNPRDSLIARAAREFDTHHRVQLLVASLNPAFGPPDGTWSVAVQLLAQALIEAHQDSLAAVWLRWALRQKPDLQPDTVQFLPEVVGALRAAASVVRRAGADTAVVTRWAWPSGESLPSQGRIVVLSPGLTAPLGVELSGVGAIEAAGTPLDPASYQITVSAPGYDSVQTTREVLPGVTTIIVTRLRAATSLVARPVPPPRATPSPVAVSKKRGKGFPWIVAVLGAGGGMGVAALLVGGHKSKGSGTGGIIITFNP